MFIQFIVLLRLVLFILFTCYRPCILLFFVVVYLILYLFYHRMNLFLVELVCKGILFNLLVNGVIKYYLILSAYYKNEDSY